MLDVLEDFRKEVAVIAALGAGVLFFFGMSLYVLWHDPAPDVEIDERIFASHRCIEVRTGDAALFLCEPRQ